jgi:hypothetical protein
MASFVVRTSESWNMENRESMNCALCETRRPRRYCPGVRGEICPVCCGTSREVTVNCPLECPHLQNARQHEKAPQPDPERLPNSDVSITERFLHDNAQLLTLACQSLLRIALASAGAVDNDVREALDALVRTYRTLETGLIYETRPANLLAAGIQQRLRGELDEARKQLREGTGMETVRDADVLGVLVMLQRMEFTRNNGRPRGRAFIDFLRQEFSEFAAPGPIETGESGLIVPG